MKKLATFASAAVLAAVAGQASATVYDISGSFDVNAIGYDIPFTLNSGSYDSDTGVGNWNATADLAVFSAGTINFDHTFTLDAATGNGTLAAPTNCVGSDASAQAACGPMGGSFQGNFTSTPAPIGEGTLTITLATQFGAMTFKPELTAQGSTIPVPAAAWLFGSAVLGLAGIGRRRKAA